LFLKNSVILIVDDSAESRGSLKRDLNELGYRNVLEAANGKSGLMKVDEAQQMGAPVTIIISDWIMPQMSGLEFLKEIRNTTHFSNLPFIMLTAHTQLNDVLKAIDAGVNSYLIKPHNVKDLSDSLTAVWNRLKVKY